MVLKPTRLLCPWDSPGKNTGVGCHFLLQGMSPTQVSNPGLLHCRWILYHLSHHTLHSGNQKKVLSLRSHEIAQLENLKLKKQTTLHRNSQNKLHCSLTWKQSLTQTFGAALSWGNVAKMLRTGENGTDFSHALCPASLKKREGEKSTFRKARAYILCLTKLSGTNLGLSWGWSQGDCSDLGNCP